MDELKTHVTPDPAVKGEMVTIHLAGILDMAIEVTNLHVHVEINGLPLWNEDHVQDNKYKQQYKYDLKWPIPSYAPKGKYHMTLVGTGNVPDAGVEN